MHSKRALRHGPSALPSPNTTVTPYTPIPPYAHPPSHHTPAIASPASLARSLPPAAPTPCPSDPLSLHLPHPVHPRPTSATKAPPRPGPDLAPCSPASRSRPTSRTSSRTSTTGTRRPGDRGPGTGDRAHSSAVLYRDAQARRPATVAALLFVRQPGFAGLVGLAGRGASRYGGQGREIGHGAVSRRPIQVARARRLFGRSASRRWRRMRMAAVVVGPGMPLCCG
jgi:hypothetical protein